MLRLIFLIIPVYMLYLCCPLFPGDPGSPCSNGIQEYGSNCLPDPDHSFIPDTSIIQAVCIEGSITSEDIFQILNDDMNQPESPVREYCFTNPDSCELLKLIQHPGTGFGKIQEIGVEKYASASNSQPPVARLKINHFQTESGIRLGISKADLIKRKGIPDADEYDQKMNVCSYFLNDADEKFLKRYNMPSYYARYCFRNDILIKFAFGFEYP